MASESFNVASLFSCLLSAYFEVRPHVPRYGCLGARDFTYEQSTPAYTV